MKRLSIPTDRPLRTALWVVMCGASLSLGCQMLDGNQFRSESGLTHNSSFKLAKNLVATSNRLDIVKLEVFLVERPLGDPLLEQDGVWSELGFLGPLSDREKKSLEELGFRVGHSSANPPPQLEQLLALGKKKNRFQLVRSQTNVSSNVIALLSDSETELQTSPYYPHCRIELPTHEGIQAREYSNARCLLKVKVQRIQDGWATFEFSPEIQFGEMKWQAAPVEEGGWTGRTTQDVETLFDHRFSVTLNLGEMVVIGAQTDAPTSLGKHFFIGSDESNRMQRLIVVRLVELPTIKADSNFIPANR